MKIGDRKSTLTHRKVGRRSTYVVGCRLRVEGDRLGEIGEGTGMVALLFKGEPAFGVGKDPLGI